MRRAMSYVAPWAAATALAVALSWLGVRDVVRGAVSDRETPPPIGGPVIHGSPSMPPPSRSVGSPTARPGPSEGDQSAATTAPVPAPTRTRTRPKPQPSRPPANVRSYATRGGRAALATVNGRVRLVSATPNPGYETRVTEADGWLRVDFLGDEHTSSVIAIWYQRAPAVRVYEY